ncbi:UTP--glucose-1-phosphate uridylyltransferase GalU [Magnetospira sp. QH-2]|uniref:UTP--glucose-1-phosphate uridylyltransferase GalU n=1 Tax=Magnetospira sp. (strain QH-2) TaxID=1288970 RepID=UPI0003E8176E|nr:UTP--glucose-1-phosphate uridylyltransferase GalU [Magnetospira sp. QH-2]CCQ73451.1 glucose-1-phosphate uridylyltransferase [Magnetospira sp. QH-2]
MSKPVRKAIFPVAGLGTRFLPATKAMPKEMLTIVDKPLIQYAVEEAMEAGIEQIILVSGRGKTSMSDHFDHSYELEQTLRARGKTEALKSVTEWLPKPGQVTVMRQQEPLGLGHAVWCARNMILDEPFAVLLADDMILSKPGCLKQMVEAFNETGGNMVAVEEVPHENTSRYGILNPVEDDGKTVRAQGLVEKPDPSVAPSNLAIIGRYILQPDVMVELERHERGAGGEIQLTDAMARTIDRIPFHGLRFDGRRFDCGSKEGFVQANVAYALNRPDLRNRVMNSLQEFCRLESDN